MEGFDVMIIHMNEIKEAASAKEAFDALVLESVDKYSKFVSNNGVPAFKQMYSFKEFQKPAGISDNDFEKLLKNKLTEVDPIAVYEVGGGDVDDSTLFEITCVDKCAISGEERWATVYVAYANVEGFLGTGTNKKSVIVPMEINVSIFQNEVLEAAQKYVSETGKSVEVRVEKRIVSDIYSKNRKNVIKEFEAIPKKSQIKKWHLIGYVQI